MNGPIAIGGLGGSGTRVVAALLVRPGFFIGGDLNGALDNLWFTLLFKRPDIRSIGDHEFAALCGVFTKGMQRQTLCGHQRALVRRAAAVARPQHPPEWLAERARSLLESRGDALPAWGWKEPNTHVVLDRLRRAMPGLRYIHVARNGLDMAYSDNQRQVRFWLRAEPTPLLSLRYWCDVQRRVLQIGASMGNDFLFLDFDALCTSPRTELRKLERFLGDGKALDERVIVAPPSIGRFKAHGLKAFDPADVAYVAELGFDTATR